MNDLDVGMSEKHAKKRRHAITPAGLRGPDAAAFVGVSHATWMRLQASGKTPAPIRLGGCVVFVRSELEQWLIAGAPDREAWEAMKAR